MQAAADLTHYQLVTHMCVIIGSGNGLALPEPITRTKARLLSNDEPPGTISNCTKIQKFPFKKMLWKTLYKGHPFFFYLNALITPLYYDDA